MVSINLSKTPEASLSLFVPISSCSATPINYACPPAHIRAMPHTSAVHSQILMDICPISLFSFGANDCWKARIPSAPCTLPTHCSEKKPYQLQLTHSSTLYCFLSFLPYQCSLFPFAALAPRDHTPAQPRCNGYFSTV